MGRTARNGCEAIVALDTRDLQEAVSLASALTPEISLFKVGMELFFANGPAAIDRIVGLGARVFCDLKLHDIPATVARAASVLVRPGVEILDVHASGGSRMMAEAAASVRAAAADRGLAAPRLVAVTVLTSIDAGSLRCELGVPAEVHAHVARMAELARESGLDGVVCSTFEIEAVRRACGEGFVTVVPGIRPAWAMDAHDQRRSATPRDAVLAGADYLVVGRPVTRARSPVDAARAILDEVRQAEEERRRG